MSFDDWFAEVNRGFFTDKLPQYEHQRYGQALMNELRKVRPKLYDSLHSTEADIFYSSRHLDNFISYCSNKWDMFE